MVSPGDLVEVQGEVDEYWGLSEVKAPPGEVTILSHGETLPLAVDLNPPATNEASRAYFESLEGMRAAPGEGRAVGPTDVQVLNHHGYRNTHHEFWVRTTRPRVLVHQNWSSDQPGMGVLKRITSTYLYPGPRDLFGLDILPVNRAFIGEAIDRAYKSTRGHVVVRVEPGGARYWVIVLDDTTESDRVTGVYGPYASR